MALSGSKVGQVCTKGTGDDMDVDTRDNIDEPTFDRVNALMEVPILSSLSRQELTILAKKLKL